jgi:glycosyltransferase involved in cell wall biosynthesis
MTLEQLRAMPSSFFGPFGTHGLSPRALRALHRQQLAIYRGAHGCCVLGSWAKDSLVQDYGLQPEKVHVIGCGRNLDVPVSPDRQWAVPRFLFVGRNWERKNGDAMVRAFVRLHDQVPEARLDVVGDHPRLSVEGVTGHGELSAQNRSERVHLELLFGQATCFVMPSLVEPFGIAYVEAAAAGLPSIATTVGGARDAVASGGILVDPHDDGAIFAAMRRLAEPAEARRLGAAAMKRSALFTWPVVAERLFRALDLPGSPGRELADFL